MESVAIVARRNLDKHQNIFRQVIKYLKSKDKQVYLEARVAELLGLKKFELFVPGSTPVDLILAMGGDGTILRVFSKLKDPTVRFFGINMGHLGFLSEIPPVQVRQTLDEIFAGRFSIDPRMMLNVKLYREGKKIHEFRSLNEVAITQGTLSRLIKLKTKVDRLKLATFRADGLLVATPTGSTAYSLSAGGPIVHPSVSAIILTPICPHSFNQKPIVLPDDKKIEIKVASGYEAMNMTIDGQRNVKLKTDDIIKVSKGGYVEFCRLPSEHYFMNLRNKLGWGERIEKSH